VTLTMADMASIRAWQDGAVATSEGAWAGTAKKANLHHRVKKRILVPARADPSARFTVTLAEAASPYRPDQARSLHHAGSAVARPLMMCDFPVSQPQVR
jgi:hypothetical protein